jgi:phage portal protein BeeE
MGIPAWYVNAEASNFTYSNVSSERRTLVDFGLRQIMHCIEARLSMDDVTPRGQKVRFDLDDFLRGNPTEQTDIAIKLTQAGIITIDEAREMVDYAPSTAIAPSGGSNESA